MIAMSVAKTPSSGMWVLQSVGFYTDLLVNFISVKITKYQREISRKFSLDTEVSGHQGRCGGDSHITTRFPRFKCMHVTVFPLK